MSGKRAQNPLICHGHTRPVVELNYSPITQDGYFLASASKDSQPMLRNGATGDWIGTFQGHKGAVWSCVLNESAIVAATGSADFSAKIWDALTGDELHNFPHKHIVRTVGFSHLKPRLVTGGAEKILRVFDLTDPGKDPEVLSDLPDRIRHAKYHQNDNLLLVSYVDKPNVSVYDMRTLEVVKTLRTPNAVSSVEVEPGQQRYITTADGPNVSFWDGRTLEPIKTHVEAFNVESASLFADRRRFVLGGEDMWVHLHDFDTLKELECNKGHHGPVHSVQFAPGGGTYASGSEDGTIRIWETDFSGRDDHVHENGNHVS